MYLTAALVAAFVVPGGATAHAPHTAQHPCSTQVTAGQFHELANRVYHQHARVTTHQKNRLTRMRLCARTPAAHRAMRRMLHRQAHARHHRTVLAARLCGTPACNRRLARHMALLRYGPGAFICLDQFIGRHESGWSDDVEFGGRHGPPRHLAWGIPQALPPQKMATAGRNWATSARVQILWLFSYVDGRYGGPCQARNYWFAHNSY